MGGEAAATIATGVPIGIIGKANVQFGGIFKPDSSDAGNGPEEAEGGEGDGEQLLKTAEPVSLPSEIQAFRDALEELLEEPKITLVVFVDDLDRCLPRTAISTLESIRLLLFLKRSAFVVAADNEFIRGAVRVHFEGIACDRGCSLSPCSPPIQLVPRLAAVRRRRIASPVFRQHLRCFGG